MSKVAATTNVMQKCGTVQKWTGHYEDGFGLAGIRLVPGQRVLVRIGSGWQQGQIRRKKVVGVELYMWVVDVMVRDVKSPAEVVLKPGLYVRIP